MWGFSGVSPLWRRRIEKTCAWIGALTLALLMIGVGYLLTRLNDDEPVTYTEIEEHFKYGSTGGERGWGYQFGFGIPYWIWIALPELFDDYLPDHRTGRGYSAFGMIYEEGRDPRFDLPIGMSMRRVQGIDRVYFNCAACHTGSIRDGPEAPRRIVLGMPANTFDLGALGTFLGQAAQDWRFRSERLLPRIAKLAELREEVYSGDGYLPAPLGPVDRVVFRYFGISQMREQLLTLTSRLAFIDLRTWGPGRVDTFNAPKALLGFRMDTAPEKEKMGNADFPAVWNQKWKRGMQLHWDGNNTAVDERNLSAGFGTGATPPTIDKEKVLRVADWLWDQAQPPSFPASRIDEELARRGAGIYRQYCWECHGSRDPPFRRDGEGSRVGTVTALAEVGTDRARLDSYTLELVAAQGSLYTGYPEDETYCREHPEDRDRCYPARFTHFRKTHGYANVPLDGLWLRAPYLHNGSVPNLRSLLEPHAARPESFYIGYDVYDFENVGFVSDGAEARARGWYFDTREWGNGNQGHEGERYGTDLAPERKDALIEYLKTF